MQNMIRIITGTLVEIGEGKKRPGDIPIILEAKDRAAAGFTAPPQGAYAGGSDILKYNFIFL